jgi:hypothetical protein
MEYEAAKANLAQALPKVAQFAKTLRDLGIGVGGATYMLKHFMGSDNK